MDPGRKSMVWVLIVVPAVVFLGLGTFLGIEAERVALRARAQADARSTLEGAARLVTDAVSARVRSEHDLAVRLLQSGQIAADPALPNSKELVVITRGPNGRVQPIHPLPLVDLGDIERFFETTALEDLRLADRLRQSDPTAALRIWTDLVESAGGGVVVQAQFRRAVAQQAEHSDAFRAVLGELLTQEPDHLSTAQRIFALHTLLTAAVERRDGAEVQRWADVAEIHLRGLVAGGTPAAPGWAAELAAAMAPAAGEVSNRIMRELEVVADLGDLVRSLPETVSAEPEWGMVAERRAYMKRLLDGQGTHMGDVFALAPETPDLLLAAGVLGNLASSEPVRVVPRRAELADAELLEAGLGEPYSDWRLVAPFPTSAGFPWRTVLSAFFMALCFGAMILGVLAYTRSQRKSEATLANRTEFLATVAHQLKTPVANLRLFAETLASGNVEPKDRSRMQSILEAEAEKLSAYLDRVLAVARLESPAAGELPRARIALGAVLESFDERWRRIAEARGVRLEMIVPEDLPDVEGDPGALSDALQNVIDNAIRYSPRGRRVQVMASGRNGEVRVRVRDEGPGIAPEHRERVFERFFRGDGARARAGEGSGLGLAIARDGARRAGGDVVIEDSGSAGTIMTFVLPTLPHHGEGS